MEAEIQRLKRELETVKSENKQLKSKLSSENSISHSKAFWNDIRSKIRNNTDYIKTLIKQGTIDMNDIDSSGKTLLHLAAWKGNYEIAKLCINLGADINKKSNQNETAFGEAMHNNNDHIEQLLLFAQTKSNVGDRIKNISQSMLKQNSIIQNIIDELELIGEQSKDIFIKILKEITLNLITKKLVFSDDLLNLCWKIETENINVNELKKSELWRTIDKTCRDIIDGTSKKDWFWMKQCLLPSNV